MESVEGEPSRRRFLAGTGLVAGAPLLAGSAVASGATREHGRSGHGRPGGERAGRVSTGADELAARQWQPLSGAKVGVFSNPTGVLGSLEHIVDDLVAAGVRPKAAFGPEHGFRGTGQAGGSEGDYTDPRTGVPVYDAYRVDVDDLVRMYRKADLDTIVFDIANVGARFYTYTWTMYLAMHAAARIGARFVVLDRPNPVGGGSFGPMLDPGYASFVGLKPIVQQPGMTSGELARMFAEEFLPEEQGSPRLSELEVIPARGWRRDETFGATGLNWIAPSPNMPTADTALVYPGTCLFEGTVLSEGRGTTRPFETVGAPGIDWRLAEKLGELDLPGVRFRECYFVPTFSKFSGKTCGGVQLHVEPDGEFDAIRTAVAAIVTIRRLYPDVFAWREDHYVDKLFGSDRLRKMVDSGASTDDIVGMWQAELAEFDRRRERYLIYR